MEASERQKRGIEDGVAYQRECNTAVTEVMAMRSVQTEVQAEVGVGFLSSIAA